MIPLIRSNLRRGVPLRVFPTVVAVVSLSGWLVGGPTGPARPMEEASGTVAVEKTYTLFMGAEVLIERDKELHRVRDVAGGALVINVKGEPVFVPINGAPIAFKVDPQLKLTAASAVFGKFKYERAYTPHNDPVRQFVREQAAAGANAQSAAAERNMVDAQAGLNGAKQVAASIPNDRAERAQMAAQLVAGVERDASLVEAKASAAFAAEARPGNQVGTYAGRLQRALGDEAFDAIDIGFEVTAKEPLNHPYIIIVAKFRAPEDRPDGIRKWIYAKELLPVTEQAREVHFQQGGFPPGFELKELQLRLYNAGREVATNLSPNRVPLTLEEAFQYVMLDYLGSHQGATLPGVVALGKLPPDFLAHVPATRAQDAYYVRVSKDGLPGQACLDPDGKTSLDDPYVAGVLHGLRFKPALEKGTPVDSVVRVKLGELPVSF